MLEPGREYSKGTGYRYGFNGKEKSDEVNGNGVNYDYGARVYDARVGRFLSVDPIENQYPELTPYQFSSDSPIESIDRDGEESKISNFFGINIKINLTAIKSKDIVTDIDLGVPHKIWTAPHRFYSTIYQVSLFASFPINNGSENIGGNIHISERQVIASAIVNVSATTVYNTTTGQLNTTNNDLNQGMAGIKVPNSFGALVDKKSFGVSAIGSLNLSTGQIGAKAQFMDMTPGFQNTTTPTPDANTTMGIGVKTFTSLFDEYAYAGVSPDKFKGRHLFRGFGKLPDLHAIPLKDLPSVKLPSYLADPISAAVKTEHKLEIGPLKLNYTLEKGIKLVVDAAKSTIPSGNTSSTNPIPH